MRKPRRTSLDLAWLGDRKGNVAIMMALIMPMMMIMVGFAIDYAHAVDIQHRINAAADTGVLAAVAPNTAYDDGSYQNAYKNHVMYNLAVDTFSANTQNISVTPSTNITITPTTSGNTLVYTAQISWTASVPTWFSGVIGINSMPIAGVASAVTSPPVYIRYFILVDNSQSMGIGATATDMSNLYTLVQNTPNQATGSETGCVFGCHVTQVGNTGVMQSQSNEALAHANGITLRIDSASSAIQNIIQTAIGYESPVSPNISIGLYTMSDYPSTTVTQVFAPTTSLSQYQTTTVDLGANNTNGIADSDFYDQINQFITNYLPAQGTGLTASSPVNYVFIITDGMVDTPGCGSFNHCTNAFQSSYCTQLKTKANVGVIYTTYLPIYSGNNAANGYEYNYSQLAASYVSSIPTNLQACATSTAFYYQASDGPSISAGMQTLFANSLTIGHLTQ